MENVIIMRKKWLCIFSIIVANTLLFAQETLVTDVSDEVAIDFERVAPKNPVPPDPATEDAIEISPEEQRMMDQELSEYSDEPLIEEMKAVILTSPNTRLPYDLYSEAKGVVIYNLKLPSAGYELLSKALMPIFYKQPLSQRKIIQIKHKILLEYKEMYHPLVIVNIPEQEITDGVLVVEIYESVLEDIVIKGNRWFSDESIRKCFSLKEGKPIDYGKLLNDLSWVNRNPFRSASAIFIPGEMEGTTDIDVMVKDRVPFRIYGGVENTGFKQTDQWRGNAGFNWGNVWGIGHMLSYQYTHSLKGDFYHSHTGVYKWPLSWQHMLTAFGGFSRVRSKDDSNYRTTGDSWQLSGRYDIPLPTKGEILHDLIFGADFKKTDNNLDYGGERILINSLDIFQFLLDYHLTYNLSKSESYFGLQVFSSPGKFFPKQSDALYNQLRTGAKVVYVYGKLAAYHEQVFGKGFSMRFNLEGQLSSQNLIQSEQFGLGGMYSVRGYLERVVNVDNALQANFELRLPSFRVLSVGEKLKQDSLTILGFIDYGFGAQHSKKEANNDRPQYNLLGVGPGVRYSVNRFLSMRFDYGFQLVKSIGDKNRGGRAHFACTVGF